MGAVVLRYPLIACQIRNSITFAEGGCSFPNLFEQMPKIKYYNAPLVWQFDAIDAVSSWFFILNSDSVSLYIFTKLCVIIGIPGEIRKVRHVMVR